MSGKMIVKQLCLVIILKYVLFIHVIVCASTPEEHAILHKRYDSLPAGHPDRCVYELTGKLAGGMRRIEALPGVGWDNLQNKEMSAVIKHEYRHCRTTTDGRMLIPDGVTVTAIKDSQLDTVAEVFQHWDEYTSTSSSSINVQADIGFDVFGIGGKYSHEYQQTKTQQYSSNSTAARMQLRYVRYRAQIETGSHLGQEFKDRLRKIAAHLVQNRTRLATYESQLLVRDYGSHVINYVDLGAALIKTDLMQITESSMKDQKSKQTMAEIAALGFFEYFEFAAAAKYSSSSSSTSDNRNSVAKLSSTISTLGGSLFKPSNFSAEEWISSIDENLVALDRSGEPLHYFVNYNTLHDLPDFVVQRVHEEVRNAVLHYYKHNTYNGCTQPDSPNFSFQANHDDGSCKPPKNTFTFGGVYQECSTTESSFIDLCRGITVKNPITGDFSCPTNYQKVLLNRGSKSSTVTQQQMYKCGHWFHHKTCYKDVYKQSHANYAAYWCVLAGEKGNQETGMLFGGVFTPNLPNILTRSNSCPKQFVALTVLDDLTICVSNDFEYGKQYALPFAGFHSCLAGNPLALGLNSKLHNMSAPNDCPAGYSQHLAVVDDGCDINFCIKTGIMVNMTLPIIKKPPYISMPLDQHLDSDISSTVFVVNSNGSEWSTLEDELNAIELEPANVQQTVLQTPLKKLGSSNQTRLDLLLLTKRVENKDWIWEQEYPSSDSPNTISKNTDFMKKEDTSTADSQDTRSENPDFMKKEETSFPDNQKTRCTEHKESYTVLYVCLIVLCLMVGILLILVFIILCLLLTGFFAVIHIWNSLMLILDGISVETENS